VVSRAAYVDGDCKLPRNRAFPTAGIVLNRQRWIDYASQNLSRCGPLVAVGVLEGRRRALADSHFASNGIDRCFHRIETIVQDIIVC
jgi:hypothetical protein